MSDFGIKVIQTRNDENCLVDENYFTAIAKAVFNRAEEDKSKFIESEEFRKMMLKIIEEYNLPSDNTIKETMKKVDR